MADKKKTKVAPPEPNPANKTEPTPMPETESTPSMSDLPNDVMAVITADMWKKGFYIKALKHQNAGKGQLVTWQVERVTSTELETQELPDIIFDKFGPGGYRLHLHNMDGKRLYKDRIFEIAVVDVNAPRSPAHQHQPDQPNPPDYRRHGFTPPSSSRDRVEARGDVQDAKARVDIAKADLELEEIAEKKRQLKDGGNNKQDIDLRIKLALNEVSDKFTVAMKDILATVKPAGDSDLKQQIAALAAKIDESKSKSESNALFTTMLQLVMSNQKSMTDAQAETFKQLMEQKTTKGKDPMEQFKDFMEMFKTKREIDREDRDEYTSRLPADLPRSEEPWWRGVISAIVDVVRDLNKDGLLTQKLANMKDPPVQPQLGKVYTPEEEDAVIKRMVDDTVEKHKKNPPADAKSITDGAVKNSPTAAETEPQAQPIPAGETLEEFNAKKNVVNTVLSVLTDEMILCPLAPEWMNLAFGKLPRDILIAIRDSKDFAGLLAILDKYADAGIMTALKAKLEADAATAEKNKSVWLAAGLNNLREAITEQFKPAVTTLAPASAATTAPGTPGGTVTQ